MIRIATFILVLLSSATVIHAQGRQAPPGMFKDLDDEKLGEALLIHGKQMFVDDYIIDDMQGVEKRLHQAVKYPENPVLERDRPSDGFQTDYGSVLYDPADGLFKMWYQVITGDQNVPTTHVYLVAYAESKDGISWEKPITDEAAGNNHIIIDPPEPFVGGPGVMIDPLDPDPNRRFKMMYVAKPEGTPSSLATHIAFSPDGIHWKQAETNPAIPFSDTAIEPYWDQKLGTYVAYLRFGPPNIRVVARIQSEDFLHWSPKVTVLGKTNLDKPYFTEFYTMNGVPYEGVYVGLLNTYHGETIVPIPEDEQWRDRVDNQLVFSRNGVTWNRVVKDGVITADELMEDRDWKKEVDAAVFLPYGESKDDWDWGQVYPHHPILVVGDEIRFYYGGTKGRHWANYHKDPFESAVGLATLRLDGFVSVDAGDEEGTLTTKPFVFMGDTIEVNANADGGSLAVEALDADGNMIEGFGKDDFDVLTADEVHHVIGWNGDRDCHLLQGRPIRLRFYLKNVELYAFTPRITQNHFLQSYD